MNDVLMDGLTINENYISVDKIFFIFDSPARSMIMNTKHAPGYFCCHKCTIEGVYVHRFSTVSFLNTGLECHRTHDDFVRRFYYDTNKTKSFHLNQDPIVLETILNIDIVKHSPIDYMHVSCLGTMKRLLNVWSKMVNDFSEIIDSFIDVLYETWPKEFVRKLRKTNMIDHYKATEFRYWLLYVGPVFVKDLLSDEQFNHFCLYYHGMRLLFAPGGPDEESIRKSELCINAFLENWPQVYDDHSALTYVVHANKHLPDDCRYMKESPDGYSAFPFESFIRKVKQNYHSGGKALEQVSLLYCFFRFLVS